MAKRALGAFAIVFGTLWLGMAGYHWLEGLSWLGCKSRPRSGEAFAAVSSVVAEASAPGELPDGGAKMDPWARSHYNHLVDFDEATQVLAAFEQEGVRYVLIGSMAMAAQGLIRATRDIDFFVSPAPDNVARLRVALKRVFEGDPNVDNITAEDLGGDYPAIEYTPPHGRYSLDILSRLGEAFRFEDLESEVLVVDGVSVQVATPAQLYRMKKGTARPQDRIDAQAIRERFKLDEED